MLENKKILLLTPDFFNYCFLIKKELESFGAEVDFYFNRPQNYFSKFWWLFNKEIYEKIKIKYFNSILNNVDLEYNYVLIIRADLIPQRFLIQLKNKYHNARFIQYIWDDIDLFPDIINSFQFFDRILSYDLIDSKKFNLKFRPFFYKEESGPKRIISSKKAEIFFIGSYHSDRLQVLETILRNNKFIKINTHFYINPITFLLNKIPFRKRQLFRFRKMEYSKMINTLQNSIAILDIQNSAQHGLTTRIFEALGTKTKIITTNENIINYEFYNLNNICIIDRKNPKIDEHWLGTPYLDYEIDIYKKYSLKSWIIDVFGLNTED